MFAVTNPPPCPLQKKISSARFDPSPSSYFIFFTQNFAIAKTASANAPTAFAGSPPPVSASTAAAAVALAAEHLSCAVLSAQPFGGRVY
jgi:hypothetical protein